MKRKRTDLEQKLIANGWVLECKTYTGKTCDKVDQYVYEKVYSREFEREDGKLVVTTWSARVLLDSKRDKVIDVLIRSPFQRFVNDITCCMVLAKIREIKQEIDNFLEKKEATNE